MVRKENGGKTMKRASKIKRLLSLTLAMACLFAVVAIPQVSAETADNPFVYVPAPNGGYVLSEVAAGEAAPRAALLSYYGIDFYHDNQFTGGSPSFTLSSESLEVVKKSASWISSCRSSIRTTTFGKTIFSSTTILPPTPTASPSLKRTSVFSCMPIIVCVLPSMRKRTSSANSASIRSATL